MVLPSGGFFVLSFPYIGPATGFEGVRAMATEQRANDRAMYRRPEKIAPYTDGSIPAAEAFTPIDCVNVSDGGFGFFADLVPRSPFLIVAVHIPGDTIYMKARVANHRSNSDDHGKPFIVGCQFIGRIFEESAWPDGDDEEEFAQA